MSILIKGMEMPTSCTVCPFENYGDCYGGKVKAIMDIDDYVSAGKRHPRCPLVPVPPHGRLIDADALLADDNRKYDTYRGANGRDAFLDDVCHRTIQWAIEDAPTIIPAEEGE